MIKQSVDKGFLIFKKDLAEQLVQKKTYLGKTEYWIFRHEPLATKLILSPQARKELEKQNKVYLHSIIITDNYFLEENDRIFVRGIKFDGEDLHNYLIKTKRN